MRKPIAVLLCCLILVSFQISAIADDSEVADLLRYLPTKLEVSDNKVVIYGYFTNLNTDCSVFNIDEFNLLLFSKGDLLISGDFGKLNNITIKPLSLVNYSFTISGSHNLNNGAYTCGSNEYADFSCTFSYK